MSKLKKYKVFFEQTIFYETDNIWAINEKEAKKMAQFSLQNDEPREVDNSEITISDIEEI